MLVVGITGQPSSGKDTISEYLVSKGFRHISSGDRIREEMQILGLPLDRSSVSNFVVERRKERGNGYLAEEISKIIDSDSIASGLRNMSETNILREKFGEIFTLLAVEAPIEKRYEWAVDRGRVGDGISFEQFKKEEEKERGGSGFHEVDNVIKAADHCFINDGTKEDLLNKVDLVLSKLKNE